MRPQIKIVSDVKQVRRKARRPMHTFNLKSRPWEITPMLIAPVLPGDTMESLLLQSRCVSDPLQNPLIGWWKEYYFFYVSHRSLLSNDEFSGYTYTDAQTRLLQTMMLDTSTDVSALKNAAHSVPFYGFKGGMNYIRMAYERIVAEFFRDEGEVLMTSGTNLWDDYALAMIQQEGWYQSLGLDNATAGDDDDELPGVDEQEEMHILTGFTSQYAHWEILRDNGMTDLTYEDYLRGQGVSVPQAENTNADGTQQFRPELLRFIRNWTYPTNHVDPITGTPSSALSWSVAERADKKRFFKEPGFVIGVTLTRPKIYLGAQKGAAVGLLDNAYSWLPQVVNDHPYTSLVKKTQSTTDGILNTTYTDYWIDLKDLFVYGDQFVNFAMAAADNHGLAMPIFTDAATDTINKKYPTESMMNSLFKTTDGTKSYVREDGVVHFNFLSRVVDTTPGS